MHFHPANLRKLPLLVGAAVALVFSAMAQQGGEPIIFSSPDGGNVDDGNVSSNLTHLSKPEDLPDTASFAPSGFAPNLPTGDAPPLAIPSAVSISEGQQLQNMLNPKKDWALMTPGEIMGVASPEKILQVPERDAMGLRKNSSALESFLGRQSESQSGATNGFSQDNPASAWHFPNNPDFQSGADTANPVSGTLGNMPQTLSRFFNNTPQRGDNFFNPNADASSGKLFDGSSPLQAPDSAQPTEMDRLQKLLGASPAVQSQTPAANFSSGGNFISMPSSANYSFGQPVVNPAGASYTPLTSGIGTPTGLTPMPTVTGPSSLQPAIAPAWAPQAPPWMSQGPQPFVIPQRKF
jgi:hypothetical protein